MSYARTLESKIKIFFLQLHLTCKKKKEKEKILFVIISATSWILVVAWFSFPLSNKKIAISLKCFYLQYSNGFVYSGDIPPYVI